MPLVCSMVLLGSTKVVNLMGVVDAMGVADAMGVVGATRLVDVMVVKLAASVMTPTGAMAKAGMLLTGKVG